MVTVFSLIVVLFSVIIHEVAHGSVASYLGDQTAKYSGRLTLNPIKHLDFFGSIILPLSLAILGLPVIAWAKPVPVNPYNFRDQRWGELKVSLAGPASNFLIATIFALILRFFSLPNSFVDFFSLISIYNFLLGTFNLIPIPPLDGSWILFSFFPRSLAKVKLFLQQYGMFILIFLIFFISSGLNWVFLGAQALFHLISGQ
jgi:Zn-dependent protease